MSDFRIRSMVLGAISTNCYLIFHNETKKAVIIDPAENAPYIKKRCADLGLLPEAILLTHGHFDHIQAAKALKKEYDCPIYAGRNEVGILREPDESVSSMVEDMSQLAITPDQLVKDGDILKLAGFEIRVLETPGHTAGSVCYYIASEDVLISGDTLFQEGLGRTDFPTGSSRQIIDSILNKLFALPEDTMVYPGHGEETTIKYEKVYNPVAFYARCR